MYNVGLLDMLLTAIITPLAVVKKTWSGHLNLTKPSRQRIDARLVMLHTISSSYKEKTRQTHTTSQIPPEHAISLIPNAIHTHTTQTASFLSSNNTKLEESPLNIVKIDQILNHSNQLFHLLTIGYLLFIWGLMAVHY